MNIEDSLRNFKDQLAWEPAVQNQEKIKAYGKIIACGMGGSRLPAGFLKTIRPDLNIQIWNDYGLPPGYGRDSFVVIVSYSGMTEEAIGNFIATQEAGLQTAVITAGGDLLNLAKQRGVPYVQIPEGLHPRMSVGYMLKAWAHILGDNPLKETITNALNGLEDMEQTGKAIAESIHGIPAIYSSRNNFFLADYWKISMNETAKIPAFSNVLPELAHNELAGIAQPMSFILLRDPDDHQRIQIKFGALESVLKEKGFAVINFNLSGSQEHKVFSSYFAANWSALSLAHKNGIDPDESSLIQEFKNRILGNG